MDYQSGYIKKICSFYAGDCHFAAMILPYVIKMNKIQANIVTVLDNEINKYIDKLLENINIDENLKNSIKKIGWNSLNIKEKELKKYFNEKLQRNKENIFIIKMQSNDLLYKKLEQIIQEQSQNILRDNIKIDLINCYNIENLKSVDNIISGYEYVLNTSGIHEIKKVFQCNLNKNEKIVKNKFAV